MDQNGPTQNVAPSGGGVKESIAETNFSPAAGRLQIGRRGPARPGMAGTAILNPAVLVEPGAGGMALLGQPGITSIPDIIGIFPSASANGVQQIVLQQTDTASLDSGAMCSGGDAISGTAVSKKATKNGAPGTTSLAVILNAGISGFVGVQFETAANEPNMTIWQAGPWTITLNVTAANSQITWTDAYVCRVNSSGVSQATVASLNSIGIVLSSTGKYTVVVPNGTQQNAASSDRIFVALLFANSNGISTNQFNFRADQVISTPIYLPCSGGVRLRAGAGSIGQIGRPGPMGPGMSVFRGFRQVVDEVPVPGDTPPTISRFRKSLSRIGTRSGTRQTHKR